MKNKVYGLEPAKLNKCPPEKLKTFILEASRERGRNRKNAPFLFYFCYEDKRKKRRENA
jgi:hypothetical protein